jgi:hypothetical protein
LFIVSTIKRATTFAAVLSTAFLLAACGGGGGGSSSTSTASNSSSSNTASSSSLASNAVAVSVDAGIDGRRPNVPYVSVTICTPGTSTCQTIDHVILDTGSFGLRLLASAVTVPLTAKTLNGMTLGECVGFADGYVWGAIRSADVTLGTQLISNAALQVIGDTSTPSMPTACATTGGVARNTVSTLGANGILGIGQKIADCGTACATTAVAGAYYTCSGTSNGTCNAAAVPMAQQVQNPVSLLSADNNGSVLIMPAVASTGATTATGQLLFGIGTRTNNALGSATVVKTDSAGQFTANFNSNVQQGSYIDSGSNGIFVDDSSFAVCSDNASFFCPSNTATFTTTLSSTVDTSSATTSVVIANAATLLSAANGTDNALPGLAGKGFTDGLDLGLPFFFGKSVFTALEGASTPGGTGPYVAF